MSDENCYVFRPDPVGLPAARLAYHQTHSAPVMAGLKAWLREKIDGKHVEPNSGLGQAITYIFKHWEPLTLFLRQAGAPLDNNRCEQVTPISELIFLLRDGDNSELALGDEAILDWRGLDRGSGNSELFRPPIAACF